MSAAIVKGPVHHAIDVLVNQNAATRRVFLEALKTLQPPDEDHTEAYLDILTRHMPQLAAFEINGGPLTVNLLDYLHDTWYNPSGTPTRPPRWVDGGADGFWPARYHPTEPIIRQGLIRALELATEKDLPLDSYWIATGDRFETLVICTPQQVTRILMTPPSRPPQNPRNLMNFADIRVIKHGGTAALELYETLEPRDQDTQVITTKLHALSLSR